MMATFKIFLTMILLLLPFDFAMGEQGFAAITMTPAADGGETYTLSMQVLALMTALSLLPAALITMTSFTRIIIVLAILRQALGTAQTPSNQILIGLALFLSLFESFFLLCYQTRFYSGKIQKFCRKVGKIFYLFRGSS